MRTPSIYLPDDLINLLDRLVRDTTSVEDFCQWAWVIFHRRLFQLEANLLLSRTERYSLVLDRFSHDAELLQAAKAFIVVKSRSVGAIDNDCLVDYTVHIESRLHNRHFEDGLSRQVLVACH